MSPGDGAPPPGQPPPTQWGRPVNGPYPPQYAAGYGPPPPGPRDRRVIWIALAVAVVVVVAGIGAAFALTGSSKPSPVAGGSASAGASSDTSFSASAAFPTQSATAPVSPPSAAVTSPEASGSTDSGVDACEPGDPANFTAVDVISAVGFVVHGEPPDSYVRAVIKKCTTAAVRAQIPALYGKDFALPGTDRTGGDNTGPIAEYVVADGSGGRLTMTLTLDSGNRYICTGISYAG